VNYEKLLDARNSISHREEFVDACLHLIENRCDRGIYNITNTGSVTTRDVVSLIREHTDLMGDCSFFDSEEEFYTTKAKTPRSNCVLDNSKLLSTGFNIRCTEEALVDSLKNWRT
jgi:UDP-glucose 4,6-dehydratase